MSSAQSIEIISPVQNSPLQQLNLLPNFFFWIKSHQYQWYDPGIILQSNLTLASRSVVYSPCPRWSWPASRGSVWRRWQTEGVWLYWLAPQSEKGQSWPAQRTWRRSHIWRPERPLMWSSWQMRQKTQKMYCDYVLFNLYYNLIFNVQFISYFIKNLHITTSQIYYVIRKYLLP